MPTSTSRLSFTDCFDYLDQALADSKGLVMAFEYEGDARQFRLRMNAARKIDREENAQTYSDNPGHPLFGRSQYDGLQIKLRRGEDKFYLVIEKVAMRVLAVMGLSELDDERELKPLEVEWEKAEPLKLTDRRF